MGALGAGGAHLDLGLEHGGGQRALARGVGDDVEVDRDGWGVGWGGVGWGGLGWAGEKAGLGGGADPASASTRGRTCGAGQPRSLVVPPPPCSRRRPDAPSAGVVSAALSAAARAPSACSAASRAPGSALAVPAAVEAPPAGGSAAAAAIAADMLAAGTKARATALSAPKRWTMRAWGGGNGGWGACSGGGTRRVSARGAQRGRATRSGGGAERRAGGAERRAGGAERGAGGAPRLRRAPGRARARARARRGVSRGAPAGAAVVTGRAAPRRGLPAPPMGRRPAPGAHVEALLFLQLVSRREPRARGANALAGLAPRLEQCAAAGAVRLRRRGGGQRRGQRGQEDEGGAAHGSRARGGRRGPGEVVGGRGRGRLGGARGEREGWPV
jgi:hypothetical protein